MLIYGFRDTNLNGTLILHSFNKIIVVDNKSTNDGESENLKSLKNATVNKNRLLIYSGEMLTNQEEEIDLRLWIDSNTDLDYMSKKFKFKLFVEGYVI